MTTKRMQMMKSIVGVILITVIGLFHDFALAQDEPKVGIFEFSLVSSDAEDKQLKNDLENKFRDKLRELKFDTQKLSSGDSLPSEIRYIINVKMESLSEEDRMKIQISLEDIKGNGSDTKIDTWKKNLEKDLTELEVWFETVCNQISAIIKNDKKEDVFIDEFKPFNFMDNKSPRDDRKLERLCNGFHRKLELKLKLNPLWKDKYELKSKESDDINHSGYEYIIFGDLYWKALSIEIEVDVHITKIGDTKHLKDYATPPYPFEDEKGSRNIALNLANYIVGHWAKLLKE